MIEEEIKIEKKDKKGCWYKRPNYKRPNNERPNK